MNYELRKHIAITDPLPHYQPGIFHDRDTIENALDKAQIKKIMQADADIDYVTWYGYTFYRESILYPEQQVGYLADISPAGGVNE